MSTELEIFNQHQADARNRLNFLVQSLLLLAGGVRLPPKSGVLSS